MIATNAYIQAIIVVTIDYVGRTNIIGTNGEGREVATRKTDFDWTLYDMTDTTLENPT